MMIDGILFIVFILVTAIVHAILEIQIEGKYGWAEKLPTKKFRGRIPQLFSEHNYVTGFHIATVGLVVVLAHFPIVFVDRWSIANELLVLSFVFLHFTAEDFLWFVLNPHFGIKKFGKKYIWWHKKWVFHIPLSYWFGIGTGVALFFVSKSMV